MPDSTRILSVLFPRTDFPQDGWLQATQGPPPFDPLDGGAIWSAQGGSFRSQDRYGRLYRTIHFDARYGGQGVELSIVIRIPAVQQLLQSYRSQKQAGRFDLPGWPDDAWKFTNLPAVFDPAVYAGVEQLLDSYRLTPLQKAWETGEATFIFPDIIPAVYDPTTQYASIQQLVEWYRGPGRQYFTNENIGIDWIFNTLPAFDPTTSLGAFQQLLGSYRAGRELDRRTLLFQARYGGFGIELSIVERLPAILQLLLSFRTPVAKKAFHLLVSDPDLGWLFTAVPPVAPFDPVNFPWAIAAERMLQRPKHHLWLAQRGWGGAAILDVPRVWSGVSQLLSSFRSETPIRNIEPLLTGPQAAWIFANLPAFDPRNFPWSVTGERTPVRERLRLSLHQWFPSEAQWIFENLPPVVPPPEGIAAVIAQMGLEVSFERRSQLDVRADLWVPEFGWITVYVPPVTRRTKGRSGYKHYFRDALRDYLPEG